MSRRSQFLAPLRNLFQGPTPFDKTPARNKRRRQANKPVPFSMQVSPLSMELLEPRMLLTVFYDLEVVAEVGGLTSAGDTITAIDPEVSINDWGRVSLVAELNGGSEAVLIGNAQSPPLNVSSGVPSSSGNYQLPQIDNDSQILVQTEIAATQTILSLDGNTPGSATTLLPHGLAIPTSFTNLYAASRAEDGEIAFLGEDAGLTKLYIADDFGFHDTITTLDNNDARPLAGAGETVVVQRQSGGTNEIVVYDGSSSKTLASTGFNDPTTLSVWSSLGIAPGIDNGGNIVVFTGDRGNGPGIFAAVNESGPWSGFSLPELITVAGENSGSTSPELGYDAAGNDLYIETIDVDNRIGVTRQGLNGVNFDGDSFIVSFIGTPNDASADNPILGGTPLLFSDQEGAWTVRVDILEQLAGLTNRVFHQTSPIPVLQLGDTIEGDVVTDITLYDPIDGASRDQSETVRTTERGDHYIAMHVTTNNGDKVIRAAHLDTDGDGLLDHWERAGGGIDIDQDGVVDLDLSEMDATIDHKDLFLEIDWLADQSDHRHEPAARATKELVEMFSNAPVSNPDGIDGIKLHIDAGSDTDPTGATFSQTMGSGSLQGGDKIGMPGDPTAHIDVVYFGQDGTVNHDLITTRSFENIKDNFFGTTEKRARELAFHYVVLADFKDFAWQRSGTVSSATNNTLTDDTYTYRFGVRNPSTDPPISDDQVSRTVRITSGKGAGQERTISSNSPNQLTLSSNWTTVPNTTSTYVVMTTGTVTGANDTTLHDDTALYKHNYKGADILITSGPANDQIRNIDSSADLTPGTRFDVGSLVSMDPLGTRNEWNAHGDPLPVAGNTYTIMDGSSGKSEVDFYDSPDFHSVPGNDFLVTGRGFGGTSVAGGAYNILFNKAMQWRTLAHELGHNLGLRHCGVTTYDFVCKPDPPPPLYLSLMSYAHQFSSSAAVVSYSDRDVTQNDTTFDDWSNLRMDFQNYFAFLGNTNGKGLGAAGAPTEEEQTLDDYIADTGGDMDRTAPTADILDTLDGMTISKNRDLTISVTGSDDVAVGEVWMLLDTDDDGVVEWELAQATSTPDEYEATFDDISGATGPRDLVAVVFDTSGNFAVDTISVEVTEDFSLLASLFTEIGLILQEALPDLADTYAIPFLEETLGDVVNLPTSFAELTDSLYDDATVTAPEDPDNLTLASPQSLLISVDGGEPVDVTVEAGVLVDKLNDGLTAAGLDTITASLDGSNHLSLVAESARTLQVTTVRLTAANPVQVNFGQLASDADFTLSVTRTDADDVDTTEAINIFIDSEMTVGVPHTEDNALASDLVDDLNAALLAAGETGLTALIDGSNVLALAATDPTITTLEITADAGGNLADLGFTVGATIVASDSIFGFTVLHGIGELSFSSLPDFADAVELILGVVDVDLDHDLVTDTVYFDFDWSKEFEKSVDLTLLDEGIDLGIFGRLEIVALADASFTVDASLAFRLGVYLGELGLDFTLDGNTALSDLGGGDGVEILVGITADNPAPANGQIGHDTTITLELEREDPLQDSVHVLTLYEEPSLGNPDRPATNDNFDVSSLVSDLNRALEQANLDEIVEAAVFTLEDTDGNPLEERIRLRGINSDPAASPLIAMSVSGGADLGFAATQESNYPDLVISTGGNDYEIILDGSRTVQDVIDAIDTQTAGNIAASVNDDANGLDLSAAAAVTVTAGFALTTDVDGTADGDEVVSSAAGAGLGILDSGNDGSSLEGSALHGQSLSNRVFLVHDNLQNEVPSATFNATLVANLDASAALSKLQLDLETTTPLNFEVIASIELTDPNPDGAIYLSEILETPGDIIDLGGATLNASGSGVLELSSTNTASDVLNAVSDGGASLVTLSMDFNQVDGFTFEADADFKNFLSSFTDFCIQDLLTLLTNIANKLKADADLPIMNTDLPLLDMSLNDVIAFADGLLEAVNDFVASIDLEEVELAIGEINTAISNLSLPTEDREDLFRIGELLVGILSVPEQAGGELNVDFQTRLSEFNLRLPGKLLSGWGQLSRLLAAVPGGTVGLADLDTAIGSLGDLLPSWNTVESRLENAISDALVGLGFDANDVTFKLGFIDDYNGDTVLGDRAVVVGLELAPSDPLYSDTFTPQLPISAEFGPLAFNVDPNLAVVVGGRLALGFGVTIDSSPTMFVIVDPPVDPNDDLFKTELNVNFGFDGLVSTGITFGAFDVVDVDGDLSLLAAVHDSTEDNDITLVGNTVTLTDTPIADERFVILTVNDTRREPNTFSISGNSLVFLSGTPAGGDTIEVEYQTAATPSDPANLLSDAAQRAQVDVDFVPLAGVTNPALGAVEFGDWFDNVNVTTSGMVTGSLDASLLGNEVNDAVTLAVGMNHLAEPQFVVDEEALLSLFTNLDFNFKTIVTGIQSLLEFLEEKMTSEVMTELPIVGEGFDMTGTFLGRMNDQFVTPLADFLCDVSGSLEEVAERVEREIFDLLGPALNAVDDPLGFGLSKGMDILGDKDNSGTIDLADVTVDITVNSFEVNFQLAGSDSIATDFDIGLDGLPFELEGQGGAELVWDYEMNFGVGVNTTQGFYLVVDPLEPEISLELDAHLIVENSMPTSLSADLFGLNLSVTDNLDGGNPGTKLVGTLEFELYDAGDGRFPISSFLSTPIDQVFNITLAGDATIDLLLEAGLNSNLPSVQTNLVASWEPSLSIIDGEVEADFDNLTVGFQDTGINLGDFLSGPVGSVLARINQYLEPIEPVIRLLKQEVPGVSELSEAAGKGSKTFLDLALIDEPELAETARKFVDALDTILTLADAIETMDDGSTIITLMEDVTLAGPGDDPNDPDWADSVDAEQEVINAGGQSGDAASESSGPIRSLLQQVEELGINLHFLDVQNIIAMLLGQPFDVISYELPRFELPFSYEQKFPVWPVPPISVEVGLHASFSADLSVGYDSHGIDTGNFFDGFYFGDREEVFVGADISEFELSLGVSVAALLDVLIASAGIEGEIRADIVANWRDLDDNGKMHLDELAQILNTDGIACVFDLSGELRALVKLVYEALWVEGSHTFIDVLLFSFDNTCPTFELAHVAEAGESLPNGTTASEGTLIIHTGHFAGMRGPGSSSDVAEDITVTQVADGVYDVEGLDLQSRYSGVNSIFFDGGNGNDALRLDSVTVEVTAYGGGGDDILEGGTADDTLHGESGSDQITGGGGADTINGGSGDDTIDAGTGNDIVDGGTGDDTINGGQGVDRLYGGGGHDVIDGGEHDDRIYGEAGNDIIYGRTGNDIINGGGNNDWIEGGEGDDTIDGAAGTDFILGHTGNDTINGGSGGDFIAGGYGDDLLVGDAGNDLIVGDLPNNGNTEQEELIVTAFGGLFGFDAADLAAWATGIGIDGNDVLRGGLNNDLLVGDHGDDDFFGGWGDDVIIVHRILYRDTTHAEYIEGGPDNDFICSADGPDEIYGGTADTGLVFLEADGGGSFGGFTVTSCDNVPTFETTDPSTISGGKFNDANNNGLWDDGESGLTGWTINLYDVEGDLAATAVTGSDGSYEFTALDYGTYSLGESVDPDSGYQQTFPALGGSHLVTVEAGETATDINFGNYFMAASINGQKFHDADGDGVHDAGETGINGWEILLYDNLGNQLSSMLTVDYDINGNESIEPTSERGRYAFGDLQPGTYWVAEVPQSNWIQSHPLLASNNVFTPIVDDGFTQTRSDAIATGLTGAISDVDVTLNITHEAVGQLDAFLLSPSGTRVDLFSNVGGEEADFDDVEFNDETTTTSIVDGSAPFAATYNPEDPLANFDGENPNGTWTLVLKDETEGTDGQLHHWSLTINTDDGGLATIAGGGTSPFHSDRTVWYQIELNVGEQAEDIDFGNYTPASVSGEKWKDHDGNRSRNGNEPGMAGVTIYADLNNNEQLDRLEPSTVTQADDPDTLQVDETGWYTLSPLPLGIQVIREVIPTRMRQTYPANVAGQPIGYTIDTTAANELPQLDFGNQPRGDIEGWKWEDLNGNGLQDPGEPGLAGVIVYSDVNDNGQLDDGEPFTVTVGDNPNTHGVDETGQYTLEDLPVGSHVIREIVPDDYLQTSGGGQIVYKNDFEQGPLGGEWSAGQLQQTPRHGRGFLGQFDNETVALSVPNLPAHDQLTLEFELYAIGAWDDESAQLGDAPDRFSLLEMAGGEQIETTISNVDLEGTLGFEQPDGSRVDSVHAFRYLFDHVAANLQFDFSVSGLLNIPEVQTAEWGLDNVVVTIPDDAHRVNLAPREVLDGIDFGNQRQEGNVEGTKWNDHNGDGFQQPHETGMAGVTIYADMNDNQQLDEGEPSTVTMADDPRTANEDESGYYQLTNLPARSLTIREVVPTGYTQITAGSSTIYNEDFEQDSIGSEWSTTATSKTPVGDRGFLGQFANDSVSLTLNDLSTHDALTVEFDLFVMGSWDGNHPTQGPDRWQLDVRNERTLLDTTFSNTKDTSLTWHNPQNRYDVDSNGAATPLDAVVLINDINSKGARLLSAPTMTANEEFYFSDVSNDGFTTARDALMVINLLNNPENTVNEPLVRESFYAQSFPDLWGDADHRLQTGADETRTLGFGPYADSADESGQEFVDSVYHLGFTFEHSGTSLVLDFRALGLRNEQFDFEKWGLDNVTVSIPQETHQVVVPTNDVVRHVDFYNQPDPGTIEGIKWLDTNSNGQQDENEQPLAGVTIFVDLNENGAQEGFEPATVTLTDDLNTSDVDETGSYQLTNVPPGTHMVREIVPDGFSATHPVQGFHVTTLQPGATVRNVNFGNRYDTDEALDFGDALDEPYPTLLASNGARHTVVAGVYLGETIDVDADGQPNPTATGDDADGNNDDDGVKFVSAFEAGKQAVVEVTASVSGFLNAWFDFNADGDWLDVGEQVFTDLALSGGTTTLLVNVPAQQIPELLLTRFRFSTHTGSQPTGLASDGEVEDYQVPAQLSTGQSNATGRSNHASGDVEISGFVWNDLNADRAPNPGEPGIDNVVVYADVNGNKDYDNGEPSVLTESDDPNTPPDETGSYLLTGVPAGDNILIRQLVPTGYYQQFPYASGDAHIVAASQNEHVTRIDFGNRALGGSVEGTKWDDRNGNGTMDENETGLAGVTIYADLNGNKQWDGDEPYTVTVPDDPGSTADESGQYWLNGLSSGQFTIREIAPTDYLPTFPTDGHTVSLTGEQEPIRNKDFGNQPQFADVSGIKWKDLDGDGQRDANEPGLPDVTIYVDLNNNGQLDEGEPSAKTMANDPATPQNEDGVYQLTPVSPASTVVIAEIEPVGFTQTYPAAGTHILSNVQAGQTILNIDFGNQPSGTVYGTKWQDTNGDGSFDSSEPGLAGVIIYADTNNNGQFEGTEPNTLTMADNPGTTSTDETGRYLLSNVPSGEATIREQLGGLGLQVPTLANGLPDLADGETFTAGNPGATVTFEFDLNDSAATANTAITFSTSTSLDVMAESIAAALEGADLGFDATPLAAGVIGLQATADDLLDVTNSSLILLGSLAGEMGFASTYPEGGKHVVTIGQGQTVDDVNFGNQPILTDVTGIKWQDDNGNANQDEGEIGLAGVRIYVDFNKNGNLDEGEPSVLTMGDNAATPLVNELGSYALPGLPAGTLVIRELVPTGYVQTYPADHHVVAQPGGGLAVNVDFGNQPVADIHGTKWNDQNGDAIRNEGEPGLAGVWIYADLDDDGRIDLGEPATITNELGIYSLQDIPLGEVIVREVMPQGFAQTFPANGFHTLALGQSITGVDFGNIPEGDSSIYGRKWEDLDGDGQMDENEHGLPGVTIYIDSNGNGQHDDGEPLAVTAIDDPNTGQDETGQFWLGNITVNTWIVREVVPDGYIQTYPSTGYHSVQTSTEQSVHAVNFGNHEPQGEIHGTKWDDATGDLGHRDEGDPGLAGVTIYLDLNDNGQLDDGEPTTVTTGDDHLTASVDESGNYHFTGVPPGTYVVREVVPDGHHQSFPVGSDSHTVEVGANQAVRDIDFGNFLYTPLDDGDDVVYAGAGDDLVYGDNLVSDPRVISTGTLQDTLYGENGRDTLYGQQKEDELDGGQGNDDETLDGGEDIDRVLQTSNNNQTLTTIDFVTAHSQLVAEGTDTLLSIERATLTGESGPNMINAIAFTIGPVILFGGDGDDTLNATAFDDTLEGGDGDDILNGHDGDDSMAGQAGDDIYDGGNGNDAYLFDEALLAESDTVSESGVGDVDLLDFSSFPNTDVVTVDLTAGTGSTNNRSLTFTTLGTIEDVYGGAANDVITGNSVANHLVGNDGNDTLSGQGGNDTLEGGPGSDTINGGPGADTIIGGADADTLAGDAGNDLFLFAAGWGTGETLADSGGTDTVDFSSLSVDLTFSIGSLTVTDGSNTLTHAGNDIDVVLSGTGNDTFEFADAAVLGDGTGTIDAGDGTDLLDYSAYTSSVTVDLSGSPATATGTGSVTGIENVLGGSAGDTITGSNDVDNELTGGPGNDILSGLNGDDILNGGGNNDTLRGGPGNDLYRFDPGTAGEVDTVAELNAEGTDTLDFSSEVVGLEIDLTNNSIVPVLPAGRGVNVELAGQAVNFEIVIGTDLDDTITANGQNNRLFGGSGDEQYIFPNGLTGSVTLLDADGSDTLDFSAFVTSVTFDMSLAENTFSGLTIRLQNVNGVDTPTGYENLTGGSHDDVLTGNDLANEIRGNDGNDTVVAGRGDDILVIGNGTNDIAGGVGNDTYVFSDPGSVSTTTLREDAGTIGGGTLSPGGRDTIDLTAVTTPVTFSLTVAVNLLTDHTVNLQDTGGSATAEHFEDILGSSSAVNILTGNEADNLLAGGLADDTLDGGAEGNNILLGFFGNDTLIALTGRDLMVGGLGTDSLSSGVGEDILISGRTSYGNPLDRDAFYTIRRTWVSTVNDYESRIDEIMDGLGIDSILLDNGITVFDDNLANSLDGDDDLDWFFANLFDTVVVDPDGLTEQID